MPSGISPRFDVATPAHTESAADRILLTLLALGLMLLAFFAVLTSTATFDQRRMRDVVVSLQTAFVPARKEEKKVEAPVVDDGALRAAVSALRAAVTDIFVGVLPVDNSAPSKTTMMPDRVELDVAMPVFFAENEAVLYPLPVLDKLVALLNAPPAGYRMELVVRAAGETPDVELDRARIAALADGLVRRGLPLSALSVGVLQDTANTNARALRFTFLLLETDDDLAAVRMMNAGKGTP
jgi:hypothetical protein